MFKRTILLIVLMPVVAGLACVFPAMFATPSPTEVAVRTSLPGTTVTVTATPTPTQSPLATATPIPTVVPPPPIVEVPQSIVDIGGAQYRAYQSPGDGFRIVCQEPCPIDQRLIFAKYAGLKVAKEQLVQLMGVDVLPELSPVDIHLSSDTTCGTYTPGMTGYAGSYPGGGQGYVCLFDLEKENRWLAFTPENAVKIEDQLLAIHEYAHVILYRRHEASYEDLVKAVSFYICERRTDPCDATLNQPGQGQLIYELCQQNGFRYDHLAPSLIELDQLYQAGLGELDFGWSQPTTSIYQYRLILDRILGGDTFPAFLSVGYSPPMLGDGALITPGGGTVSLAGGYLTLVVPPDAVAQDTSITMLILHRAPAEPPNLRFTFQLSCDLRPSDINFTEPVQLTLRYDPALLLQADEWIPSGQVQESSLRLYKVVNNGWQQVDGTSVDTVNKTVTGLITSLGQYGILGSAGP